MIRRLLRAAADHPASQVLQNAGLGAPLARSLQRRRTVTGAMNDPDLVTAWAGKVLAATREAGLEPTRSSFLEIGPGHSLGVAVSLLLAESADVTALDVYRFADPNEIESLRPVAEKCAAVGLSGHGAPPLKDALARLKYVVSAGAWPLADGSVDVVYSFYAGEHLRSAVHVLDEAARVLRADGVAMLAIDLRDHWHFEGNWLKSLEYEPWLWEAMTSRRGKWTNRLRAPQWRDLFEERFELLRFDADHWRLPEEFDRARLTEPFVHMSTHDLSVGALWVVARKRF